MRTAYNRFFFPPLSSFSLYSPSYNEIADLSWQISIFNDSKLYKLFPAILVGISRIREYIRNKQMLLLIWHYVPITHSCTANTNAGIFNRQAALLSCGNSSPEYWNSLTFAFSISHTCARCYEPVISGNLNLSVLYCARFKVLTVLLLKIHGFCCCVTGWDILKILKDHNAFIFGLKQLECEWPF